MKSRKRESNESAQNWSGASESIPPIEQDELNDLVRDLYLTKTDSELLASRLKRFLDGNVRISSFRNRSKTFAKFFTKKGQYCYCNDVGGLFAALEQEYNPDDWRLFIDGSKYSVKAVLLNKRNEKPSIPLAHAVGVKESYEVMKTLLELLSYKTHEWNICCDLKLVGMLTWLQSGYTKFCCFLCLWDSRARDHHYSGRTWPAQDQHVIGEANIHNAALVEKSNIILPALHIKLGLMKNFVKTLSPDSEAFSYFVKNSQTVDTENKGRYICRATNKEAAQRLGIR